MLWKLIYHIASRGRLRVHLEGSYYHLESDVQSWKLCHVFIISAYSNIATLVCKLFFTVTSLKEITKLDAERAAGIIYLLK